MNEKETFKLSVKAPKSTLEDMATESIFEYIEEIFEYEPDEHGGYYIALIMAYSELVDRFNHAKGWAQGELDKIFLTHKGVG